MTRIPNEVFLCSELKAVVSEIIFLEHLFYAKEDKGLHCFNLSGEGSLDEEANVTVKLTVKSVSGVVEKQGHTLEKAMNLDGKIVFF